MPLSGTFAEFHDLFREVLAKLDNHEGIDRLDAYLARFPPLEQLEAWFEDAGLVDLKAEYDTFTILFKSSREFFFAPVIEYGPLNHWKAIAGKGQKMQDAFWHAKESIDAYFQGRPFAVTVHVGCVRGRKQTVEEARVHPRPPSEAAGPEEVYREPGAPAAPIDDDEVATGEVELVTGDFDVISDEKQRELAQVDGVDVDDDEIEEPIL
jgi:hypothetical protein